MGDLMHYEVRLVRAPKDKVWKTVSDLKTDFIDADVKVTGTGKGATRTVDFGKNVREEKVVDMKEKEAVVLELKEGDKVEGRMELELEDHDLGTMVIHRAFLDVKGPIKSLTTKGKVKKELRQRVDGIKETVENGTAKTSSKTDSTGARSKKTKSKSGSKKSASKKPTSKKSTSKGGSKKSP